MSSEHVQVFSFMCKYLVPSDGSKHGQGQATRELGSSQSNFRIHLHCPQYAEDISMVLSLPNGFLLAAIVL